MPFERNSPIADMLSPVYGEYESTFISENGQVRADLFRKRGSLVAYISFPEGWSLQNVTDNFVVALQRHAAEIGLQGKLQMKYSETY